MKIVKTTEALVLGLLVAIATASTLSAQTGGGSGTLTLNTPTAVTINTAGQDDELTFNGTAGEVVNVWATNATFSGCYSLQLSVLNPDGSSLAITNLCNSAVGGLSLLTLPTTGTYTVVVAPQNAQTGSVNVTLSNEQTGTSLALNTPTAVTINTAGQDDELTFSGTAGEVVNVWATNSTFSGCYSLQLNVLRPDGSSLANTNLCNSAVGGLSLLTLPTTGTYTVVVAPQNAQTGSVNVTLSNEQTGTSLALNTPTAVTINTAGQDDELTFSGTAGEVVNVWATNATFSGCYSLQLSVLNPDGSSLAITNLCNSAVGGLSLLTLPTTGTYTVVVAPQNAQTGSVNVTLSSPLRGSLVAGTPQAVTISTVGQNAELTFFGTVGAEATVAIANSTFAGCYSPQINILNPDGSTLTNTGMCGSSGATPQLTLTMNGTYTVALVPQNGVTGSANIELTFANPTPTPTLSLASGAYFAAERITISDSATGSTIYYTTDGTAPTTSSSVYTAPITVSSTETLNAIAVASGNAPSGEVTGSYTIALPGALMVYVSPPGAQSTTVTGAATETFDGLATGVHTSAYVSTAGIGTYSGSSTNPYAILSHDLFGGAIDSTSTIPTNYLAEGNATQSTAPVILHLAQPAAYFGFWWSAGDAANRVALYSGNTLYGTFSTADLLNFLNHGSGTITATDGTAYQTSAYFGNPNLSSGNNDGGEPFAYVSFVITGATIDTIAFYNTNTGSAFESDNHSAIFAGNTVTLPTTYVPVESLTLTPQVAQPAFTPSSGTYATPPTVTISTSTTGASINYTIDGTTPTSTTGISYSHPLAVAQSQTIQAIAYSSNGMTDSIVSSASYVIPLTVSVAPGNATVNAGRQQQFTATVVGSSNLGVTWSVTPTGSGTISSTGLYTAPAGIAANQTVTVTATSTADTTKSASATIALLPQRCTASGYSYRRALTVDHTQVPNTDQTSFPMLVSGTYPFLATAANGGKVQSASGYDIIFTSDAAGQAPLAFEIDTYNGRTGAASFWVNIPILSHSTDTAIYMWYGNATISASQENKPGVWSNQYVAVYHMGDGTNLNTADSTGTNGTATNVGVIAGAGAIGGGGSFANQNNPSYLDAGNNSNLKPSENLTLEAWFNANSITAWNKLIGLDYRADGSWNSPYLAYALQNFSNSSDMGFQITEAGNGPAIPTPNSYSLNTWNHAVGTYDGNQMIVYLNGVPSQPSALGGPIDYGTSLDVTIGARSPYSISNPEGWHGLLDEVRISSATRSPDWIAAEYSNESSPSTFYSVSAENAIVSPSTVSLYASQAQQFSVIPVAGCNDAVTWSVTPAGLGTVTAGGVYTAPLNIASQQTVTITAIGLGGTDTGSAIITLLPANAQSVLTLTPRAAPPYTAGTTQSFAAKLTDAAGNPQTGVSVTFTVSGVNAGVGQVVTGNGGVATFTYAGTNSGTDNIQSSATPNGQPISSSQLSVVWLPPASSTGQPSLSLSPAGLTPTLGLTGLCGAFTDNTGAVIQPLSIGSQSKILTVPAGATQLQLGVDDDRYSDNTGSFAVTVNGLPLTVLGTSMPWTWVNGGLNTNYPFGLNDGTAPIVAATGLVAGQNVIVAYQSGTISAGVIWPNVNGSGDQAAITGSTTGSTGAYFSTLYMYDLSLPVGQSITFTGTVTNTSGAPIPSTPVAFNVAGANAQQSSSIANASGEASFTYVGQNAGLDSIQATTTPIGGSLLTSSTTNIMWTPGPQSSSQGRLTLTPASVTPSVTGGQQVFTVLVENALGSPVANVAVDLSIWGADNNQLQSVTGSNGQATFTYQNTNSGSDNIVAVALLGGTVVYSNSVSIQWTSAPPGGGSAGGSQSGPISMIITANPTVTMPNALAIVAIVSDSSLPSGPQPTLSWTQLSGPGSATFAPANQANTSASFNDPGDYVLQLAASDGTNSLNGQVQVSVISGGGTQGWLATPVSGSTVTGVVPITLVPGETITTGRLIYYSGSDQNTQVPVVLNANVSGSGQIGTFDTTLLQNGSYSIQLEATDTSGGFVYSNALVTVVGQYKPGRVTASVTDLVVPATGLAINIQRNYDSLNAATSGDFGYGWNLSTNVNLTVDSSSNVAFTLGGQRRTFYFTPQIPPCTIVGCLFNSYFGGYTAEPGLPGTLTAQLNESQCPLDIVAPDTSFWVCSTGLLYSPLSYTYTDASGTQYSIGANGSLNSITDIGGNGLTITPAGITSTTGLSVPFQRDSSGRITQITDPQGNAYLYSYDSSGNLATVTYPGVAQPSTYTYASGHLYTGGTDFRSNPLPTTTYTADGRVQSVTDSLGETTSYVYDLATNTTTTTNPPDANGNIGTTVAVYDSYGMLLSSTDPLGLTTTNTYDANHHLTSVTDPLGHVNASTYDADGNKLSATYPQTSNSTNTTSTISYNQYSEPTSTTDELGNVRTFNYDGNYWPQSVTDTVAGQPATLMSTIFNASGQMQAGAIGYDISANPTFASQFTYDENGNLASKTDALGRATTYTYDPLGRKLTMTEPLPTAGTSPAAATTTYTYDSLGHLIQTAAPLGRTTNSTYDSNGNKTSDTDPLGNVTTYQYDALNRLTTTTYPTQPVTTSTRTYDFRNNLVTETDQAGHVTFRQYDLSGRLTSVTNAYGTSNATTTSYTYLNDGRKQSETDSLGHSTTYTYDAAGRLIATSGVKGMLRYGYDAAGNRISTTDANNNTTHFQYDARKRLALTTYPDGTTVGNAYDSPGNLTGVTDQAGNTVNYTYDAANQLQTVVQQNHPIPAHNTNSYAYDPLGNLSSLSDENQHVTFNSFDELSQLRQKTLPDGALTETRSYDSSGNLVSLTHFNGVATTYTYDNLNRLLSRSTPGEAAVSWTYTATGKRASMTDASGTTTYSYDSADRLMTKATPEGTLHYTYNGAGNVASIASSNANGASASYTYDTLNRLSTVVDNRLPSGQNTTTYGYDPASNLATVTYPNGIISTFTYDQQNRLTALSSPIANYSYQLGATGNRTSATESSGRAVNWSYNGVYQLTSESIASDPSGNNGSTRYGLDPVGNRLSVASNLSGIQSGTFGFNADDELSGETYDANGNVLASGGETFVYDSENHLITMNGGRPVSMLYDGDGNRVAKTVNGVTISYLVDNLNPTGYAQVVEELSGAGVQREYTYGLQRISQQQLLSNAWTNNFYGYDGDGNITELTNSAGAISDTYVYDAFGTSFSASDTTPNAYRYRGEEYDTDLGLYYFRARYYNPLTGRFLSRDPEDVINTDPARLHKYLYAGGDPINKKDPTGYDFVDITLIDVNVAFRQAAALTAVTAGVACIFNESAELLQGLATDITASIESINFGLCSARVKKKNQCSCDAKCTEHIIGMPNHGNTGIYYSGSGIANSCPAAQVAARKDAESRMALGSHAQHCSFKCSQ